jgi:hypothetical protein
MAKHASIQDYSLLGLQLSMELSLFELRLAVPPTTSDREARYGQTWARGAPKLWPGEQVEGGTLPLPRETLQSPSFFLGPTGLK